MFLVKHFRPDIANVARALSKANDGVSPEAFQELLQVIRYVLDTKNLGLRLEPTGNARKTLGNVFPMIVTMPEIL